MATVRSRRYERWRRLLSTFLLLLWVAPAWGHPKPQLSLWLGDQPGVSAALEQLDPARATAITNAVAAWSDADPELHGTRRQAEQAVAFLIVEPDFGVEAVAVVVEVLAPSSAQAFMIGLAGTASKPDARSRARARDALEALKAPLQGAPLDDWLGSNLVGLCGLRELNGLRILEVDTLPSKKRHALRRARLSAPAADPGSQLQKIIKLRDLERYLSGEFQPTVGGAVALYEQVAFLRTPAELIAGLRLDYPGGFAGEQRVAALVFPRPHEMWLSVPFDPLLGGSPRPDLVYPFTGTGFTANLQGRLVPEFVLLHEERQPLPVGAQLLEIDESGNRHLRAVLGSDRRWCRTAH